MEFRVFVESYWTYYLSLERRFAQTERFCAISKQNAGAYSVEYLTLFLSVCGEIDVLAKEITAINYPDVDLSGCTMKKWGYYLCETFPDIGKRSEEFADRFQFRPFDNWKQILTVGRKGQPVYKRAEDASPLQWWTDYNSVKHSRTTIDATRGITNFEKANQENLLKAIGALFLMNRLMMQRIDPDGYSALERSSLFKLCDSIDETRGYLCWDSQGLPTMQMRPGPKSKQ